MRIKWKVAVNGTVHNVDGGVKVGDVMDVDDESAASYIAAGLAEAVRAHHVPVEHAVASVEEERAVVETEPVKPPEDPPEQDTKRGPGRPRKTT